MSVTSHKNLDADEDQHLDAQECALPIEQKARKIGLKPIVAYAPDDDQQSENDAAARKRRSRKKRKMEGIEAVSVDTAQQYKELIVDIARASRSANPTAAVTHLLQEALDAQTKLQRQNAHYILWTGFSIAVGGLLAVAIILALVD